MLGKFKERLYSLLIKVSCKSIAHDINVPYEEVMEAITWHYMHVEKHPTYWDNAWFVETLRTKRNTLVNKIARRLHVSSENVRDAIFEFNMHLEKDTEEWDSEWFIETLMHHRRTQLADELIEKAKKRE